METQVEEVIEERPAPSLLGVFTSPVDQFEKIRLNPKILIPLLVVIAINTIGAWLMSEMVDIGKVTEGMPKDQAEIVANVAGIGMIVSGALNPIFSALVLSAIEIGIARLVKSRVTFKQLFSMNIHIAFVSAIGLLLNMAVGYAIGMDGETYVTSLAGVLGKNGTGVLGAIEVFSLWTMVLTAFGLHKTAGYPKGLAWGAAIVFFLFGIGMVLLGTLIQGAPKL